MSNKEQKEYLETYPKSTHARHFTPEINIKHPPKKQLPAVIPPKNLVALNEIRTLNRETAGVINHHSLEAVSRLTQEDMHSTAIRINENRGDIINAVRVQAEAYPNLYKTGLDSLDKMIHRAPASILESEDIIEGEFEEIKPTQTEKRCAHRVLMQIATYALMATGIVLLCAGAAPIAAVAARVMMEVWGNKSEFDDHKDERKKRLADKRKREEEEELAQEEEEKERKRIQRRLARGNARPVSEQDIEEERRRYYDIAGHRREQRDLWKASASHEEHWDTIDVILDQLVDVFKYYGIEDIQQGVNNLIPQQAVASASVNAFGNILSQMGYTYKYECPNYFVESERDLLFDLERACGSTATSVMDDISVYHFSSDTFFATVFKAGTDNYKIRVDEEC